MNLLEIAWFIALFVAAILIIDFFFDSYFTPKF